MTQYDAVWEAIKGWDIERKPGAGYAHATGSDVTIILEAIWKADDPVSDLAEQSLADSEGVTNPPSNSSPTGEGGA